MAILVHDGVRYVSGEGKNKPEPNVEYYYNANYKNMAYKVWDNKISYICEHACGYNISTDYAALVDFSDPAFVKDNGERYNELLNNAIEFYGNV